MTLLDSIRDQLPAKPHRIGVGMAGVRTAADRDRLSRAIARTWPDTPAFVGDDLLLAIEAESWSADCAAQVLLRAGDPDAALEVLAPVSSPAASALRARVSA